MIKLHWAINTFPITHITRPPGIGWSIYCSFREKGINSSTSVLESYLGGHSVGRSDFMVIPGLVKDKYKIKIGGDYEI